MANTEDFDGPDMEPDLDQDVEFGDFEEQKKSGSIGELIKTNPMAKFALIGAAILVIVVAVAMFGGEERVTPDSLVSSTDQTFKDTPGAEVSPAMQAALEEKNAQTVEEAEKTGGSAIVTPIQPPKDLLAAPTDQTIGEDPLLRWKEMQEERLRVQREQQQQQQAAQEDPAKEDKFTAMKDSFSTQMEVILTKTPAPNTLMQHVSVINMSELRKSKQPAVGSGEVVANIANNNSYADPQMGVVANMPAPKVIIPAGQIEYAQMMLEANSDIPGPVMAMIVSGPFSGGRLMGSFQKQEEYLVIQFNSLVTKKGTSVPIQAFAVNPDTSLTGLATDVDHRYFTRIILPAAAKFVEGMGSAIAQTTTTTSQSSSSTTTSSEDLDTTQELGKALEEATGKVGEVLDDEGSKEEILVRVRAGTPIGVLFMTPVTDQSIMQARSGAAYAGAPAQEGQPGVPGGTPPGYGYGYGGQQAGQGGYMNQLQQLQQGLMSQQNMLIPQQTQYGYGQAGSYGQQPAGAGIYGNFGASTNTTGR